jgi:hypothetical protein
LASGFLVSAGGVHTVVEGELGGQGEGFAVQFAVGIDEVVERSSLLWRI